MRPAFASTKSAAAFAFFLLLLLLSPVLVGKKLLPPREEIYSGMTWRYGPFSYLHQQIFEETGAIDIAFVGSSRIWAGIDTPYVQEELTKRLGYPAVVRTIGWSWLGFDALYFITQDLLEHRKVKMIVFDDEYWPAPHVAATHWFRFAENYAVLDKMPVSIQANYYFAAILGIPRNLLSSIRSNFPEEQWLPGKNHWETFYRSQNSKERLGALTAERGMSLKEPLVPFAPPIKGQSSAVRIYSPDTKDAFRYSGPVTPPWQLQFASKFATLAMEHQVKLVFLHLQPPFSDNETNNPYIQERECWPEKFGTKITMVGIPPAKLFSGILPEDFQKLFYTPDYCHFNQNGQAFFTKIITPTLLEIYEKQRTN